MCIRDSAFSEDTGYGGQFSAVYYQGIRVPRVHERVEIATPLLGRIYPKIIEVLDSGNIVKLEPFPGATRNLQWLMHRDIFWNPKGYWRHASGVAQTELDNNAKRFNSLTYMDVLSSDLKVIDAAAVSLARENNIPIIISSIFENGNLLKICKGNKGIFTIVN